jgi:ATP-dependent exoDNAse (exonuclease V) alpha subunit
MIQEHDLVVLTRDIAEYGLQRGDVGVVVHVYAGDSAYEVEFVAGDGRTVAVMTLGKHEVRPVHRHEMLHTRAMKVG